MKKFLSLTLTILLILTLSACIPDDYENVSDVPDPNLPAPQSLEELYSVYNLIERDMNKDQIDELLGEGVPNENDLGDIVNYKYFNESKSAGAYITFDSDNIVETKTLFFNSKKNLIPFSGRYISENMPLIKADVTVTKAIEIMESTPLELSCTYDKSGPISAKKLYSWYNEDGSGFMIHTENGLVTNVVYYTA